VLFRPGCGALRFVGEVSANEMTIVRWGARAFSAYEELLADPATDVWDVVGVCDALHMVNADRRRFIPLLVQRLAAPDALVRPGVTCDFGKELDAEAAHHIRRCVREAAIELLAVIGSERETPFIRPYLYDDDFAVQYAVLRALERIGGKADLDAVNAWLCDPRPRRPEEFVRRVRKC
jgi:HEAT repeat protein